MSLYCLKIQSNDDKSVVINCALGQKSGYHARLLKIDVYVNKIHSAVKGY